MPNNKKIPDDWDDCKTDEERKLWIQQEQWETEWKAKMEQDAGCYDDPPYGRYDIGGEG